MFDVLHGYARRYAPVLPVVLVVALLALPAPSGAGGDSGGGTAADAASGLLVVCCALGLLRRARRPLTRTAAAVLALPVAGIAVAATGAVDAASGLAGLGRYLQIFVLVPAAVLLLIRDRADLRLVAWAFTALALWQGGVGVHQYVTGTGASYMGSDIRAVGTFGAADVMGMSTVVAYGLVCAVGLALGPRDPATRTRRLVALGCALLLLVPLALSFSRGAWIATAVACGAQLLLAGVRRAVGVLAAVGAVVVVLVGGVGVGTAQLQDRLDSITQVTAQPDQSVVDRYTMWSAAVDMWREHPVTGVGLKNFPEYRDSHASLALSSGSDTGGAGAAFRRQPLLSPHNMYLLVLSEQGLIGFTALVGCWAALLVCGLRRLADARRWVGQGGDRGSDWDGDRGGDRGADCGLLACGLLIWQLVDFAYADIGGPSTVLTAVVLGVVAWWALADRAPATVRRGAPTGSPTGKVAAR
ncbi:O-antigen ligase family protein [Streptomyces sp. NPDC058001]|uniref:O-antigen ligase family protein n=1 Tax=Streptomyces sp. NPDC058001 TaxID=3346300 RepID=UPI0036E8BBA6